MGAQASRDAHSGCDVRIPYGPRNAGAAEGNAGRAFHPACGDDDEGEASRLVSRPRNGAAAPVGMGEVQGRDLAAGAEAGSGDGEQGVQQERIERPCRMNFLRSFIFAFWFYLSMVVVGLICLIPSWMSRGAAMSAIRFWVGLQRLMLHVICGIKTEFRGLEHLPRGACVIAMKHQSTYDTLAPFLFIRDPAYVLKKELLRAPIFGIYASRVGIPIDRQGRARSLKAMMAAAKEMVSKDRQ